RVPCVTKATAEDRDVCDSRYTRGFRVGRPYWSYEGGPPDRPRRSRRIQKTGSPRSQGFYGELRVNVLEFMWTRRSEVMLLTLEHLQIVAISILIAVALGLPLGILMTRRPSVSRPILAIANILQTIPSLALFGFLIPLPFIGGIGSRTA